MILRYSRFLLALSCASLVMMLSSCSTAFQAHQDMLLTVTEKNDLKVTGSVNKSETVDDSPFYNGQISYSPIKHVGISAKYFSYKELLEGSNNVFNDNSKEIDGDFIELAVGGYFGPDLKFRVEDSPNKLLMPMGLTGDLYIGYGKGRFQSIYGKTAEQNLEFNRLSVQAGLHFNWKIVKLSYTYRVMGLNYTKIDLTGDITQENFDAVEKLSDDNPNIYRSSSLRMQMGPRHAQFYVDMNFNNLPDNMRDFYFYEKIGGIGLIIDIDEFYKKVEMPKKMD